MLDGSSPPSFMGSLELRFYVPMDYNLVTLKEKPVPPTKPSFYFTDRGFDSEAPFTDCVVVAEMPTAVVKSILQTFPWLIRRTAAKNKILWRCGESTN